MFPERVSGGLRRIPRHGMDHASRSVHNRRQSTVINSFFCSAVGSARYSIKLCPSIGCEGISDEKTAYGQLVKLNHDSYTQRPAFLLCANHRRLNSTLSGVYFIRLYRSKQDTISLHPDSVAYLWRLAVWTGRGSQIHRSGVYFTHVGTL